MRPIWKGSLSFGLVNIPVGLYSALKPHGLSFHLFHKKDKSPIRYARVCEKEKEEVPWDEIVKGYQIKKGKYVYLEDSDFEKANIDKTSAMEIMGFVEEEKIDSIFYDKPYFIAPQKAGTKAYYLLLGALKESKTVALCRYVLHHQHEYIGALKAAKNLLILEQLHFADDFRSIKDLPLKEETSKSTKEINIAKKLIDEMKIDFEPEKYRDTYVDDLKDIIDKKAKGKKIKAKGKSRKISKSKDLSDLLSQSIKQKKRKTA